MKTKAKKKIKPRGRPKKDPKEKKINVGFTLTPKAHQLLKQNVAKGQWAAWVSMTIESTFGTPSYK